MASLSLPRVLQLKKNSLDAEREHFEKFQTLAVQKATNSVETPVKEKHVRSAIIGTFQEQSAVTYWMVAIRLPLQDNRIVAWKFCHVTHKLLREGHPACLDDSQRHIGMIQNLGKLWVHLREGYGRLVHLYCSLLVCKLKFHARNPRFPGNMQLTADELDAIAENDVNNYFQLCVELFDYMDDILNLQAAVFDSLGNARANSMTASGQCRLAALIPCAQDSSQIYDCNVRLLFRLHASLPADTLAGHRERFRQQFKKLSSFYKHASSLQYYRNLLTLPLLPSNPPNFLIQSDFGTYVTPVVSIPEPPPDEVDAVGSLIDTSDTFSLATTPDNSDGIDTRTTPSPQPDPVVERDRLIDHLQNELKRMRLEVSQMVQDRNTMMASMREHCSKLEAQIHTTKTELEEERQKAEVLAAETPEIKQKLTQTEEKAKIQDEKFQKLKGAYTQLREEHITLIRQKAEVDKTAASLRAAAAQHESAKTALQQQLNDRMKDVELLQQSASSSEEIEAYKTQIANLRTELEQAREKEAELETLKASMEALDIEHKTTTTVQQEKLTALENELKEVTENLETVKKESEEKEVALAKVKEELVGLREKSGDEYKRVVEEREAALKQVAELTQQHQQEKQDQDLLVSNLKTDLENAQQKILETESNYKSYILKLNDELDARNKEHENVVKRRDEELRETLEKLVKLDQDKTDAVEELKKQLESVTMEKDSQIIEIQKELEQKQSSIGEQNSECKVMKNTISELENKIEHTTKELQEVQSKLDNVMIELEKERTEYESEVKDKQTQIETLKDEYKQLADSTEEIITGLKSQIAEKDEQVKSHDIELNNLKDNVTKLEEELNETQAELEIGKNELLHMREEHDAFVERNENNLTLKNEELRSLHDEINKLKNEYEELTKEKQIERDELELEKQELHNKYEALDQEHSKLRKHYETMQNEKDVIIGRLNDEIVTLKLQMSHIHDSKDDEIKLLHEKIQEKESDFASQITEKDNTILEAIKNIEELKAQLEEMQTLRAKEKEDTDLLLSEKEGNSKDLLQHNTVLEADLTAARIQLQEAQKEIEKQRLKLVTTASAAALEVTSGALERVTAHDSNRAAAELAAEALKELASTTEIKGHEEKLARSAIFVAHNAAQLSAYVTEVSNLSTDIELTDKLNTECRLMLSATADCLTNLSRGQLEAPYGDARGRVGALAAAAAAADRTTAGARSVDDELADMDKAIELAAGQIEEMLAASRAGDSGVKLEVNGKILDACTTLMAAVKALVQDARKLQAELGDPGTRLKMYRRNPQWSEGLISAAKAVVFAAKLLVTSADEAVNAEGRVEGVSAAAHEVAASTAQLVAASRARAAPGSSALQRLTQASRAVTAATGAVVAVARDTSRRLNDQEALDTSALTLTATRRLEMESKVRSLELESALEAERAKLSALRARHYQLAQMQENGGLTNGQK
ncbi:huntingtin-interacting protein 1 isoform X3 [Leguminivora glycinivorella]|uniref:huntingtin-interacting protein 1 isoform X3 n=1 Tax=Leguminivora glycinivorella TaxID=1035111 RepID=UPI00200E6269|nr:huntingtin-interacting protein 1 isoform X3 [Leguminivora glycinivorella]